MAGSRVSSDSRPRHHDRKISNFNGFRELHTETEKRRGVFVIYTLFEHKNLVYCE